MSLVLTPEEAETTLVVTVTNRSNDYRRCQLFRKDQDPIYNNDVAILVYGKQGRNGYEELIRDLSEYPLPFNALRLITRHSNGSNIKSKSIVQCFLTEDIFVYSDSKVKIFNPMLYMEPSYYHGNMVDIKDFEIILDGESCIDFICGPETSYTFILNLMSEKELVFRKQKSQIKSYFPVLIRNTSDIVKRVRLFDSEFIGNSDVEIKTPPFHNDASDGNNISDLFLKSNYIKYTRIKFLYSNQDQEQRPFVFINNLGDRSPLNFIGLNRSLHDMQKNIIEWNTKGLLVDGDLVELEVSPNCNLLIMFIEDYPVINVSDVLCGTQNLMV